MTASFAPPVVATYGEADATAPLVVLLHGRGSTEQEILAWRRTSGRRTSPCGRRSPRASASAAVLRSAKGTERIYRMTMRLLSLPMPSITVSTTSPAAR